MSIQAPPLMIVRPGEANLGGGKLERTPAGQDWQDAALQMRLLLSRGSPWRSRPSWVYAEQPGTLLVVTEAGQSIGFNPAGLDRAIRGLAAEVLAAGQDRLEHLCIDKDAAAYIGHSGEIGLNIHVMHVRGGDPRSPACCAISIAARQQC